MKHCGRCKTDKPLEDFHRNAGSKDGRTTQCKVCARERSRQWNKDNKERAAKRAKKWSRENPTRRKRYMKEYYEANKERLIAANVKWNRDHPDVVKRVAAEYRKRVKEDRENVICGLVRSARVRATKRGFECVLTPEVVDAYIKLQNEQCALTGLEFDYTTDQKYRARPLTPSIDRIKSDKGYTYDNIQIVCSMVNRAKNEFSQDLFDAMCRARVAVLDGETNAPA